MDSPVPCSLAESAWRRIAAHLEAEKLRLSEEIRNYPRPIAACDLQFNHALERRAGILQDLARVHQACADLPAHTDPLASLMEFLRSSNSLDDEARREIVSLLNEGLAGHST